MPEEPTMIIRRAASTDDTALCRLAALDSQPAPRGDMLVAEVDGQIHAAVSLADGSAVADPFRHTAAYVELLQVRAMQLAEHAAARPQRARRALRVGVAQ